MIRFSKYIWLYFLISGLVLVPGIFSLFKWGLKPAIDFTGGTLLELRFKKPITPDLFKQTAETEKLSLSSIQSSGINTYVLRTQQENDAQLLQFENKLATSAGETPLVVRKETIGPVLGKELLTKALIASILAILAILLYIAYTFRNIKFGVSAIIALIHDLFVVLGIFSLLGHFLGVEVDTLFVTAVLTTMSFSVHDTIVVFDRIREYRKRDDRIPFDELSDRALTETMGRSLTNSLTLFFMLLALALMGGETVHWFIIALLIGTTSGAYSSPFVATPALLLWEKWNKRRRTSK